MIIKYTPRNEKEAFLENLTVAPAQPVIRKKIVGALNNPLFRTRTLDGISKETKLPTKVVLRAIQNDKQLARTVKVVPMRSRDGKVLITTKSRFSKEASLKEKFVDFFASKRPEVANGE